MQDIYAIELDLFPGSEIGRVSTYAVSLASITNKTVRFKFNDAVLEVPPFSDPDLIIRNYFNQKKAKNLEA